MEYCEMCNYRNGGTHEDITDTDNPPTNKIKCWNDTVYIPSPPSQSQPQPRPPQTQPPSSMTSASASTSAVATTTIARTRQQRYDEKEDAGLKQALRQSLEEHQWRQRQEQDASSAFASASTPAATTSASAGFIDLAVSGSDSENDNDTDDRKIPAIARGKKPPPTDDRKMPAIPRPPPPPQPQPPPLPPPPPQPQPIVDLVKKNLGCEYSSDDTDLMEIPTREANIRISSHSDNNLEIVASLLDEIGGREVGRDTLTRTASHNTRKTTSKKPKVSSNDVNSLSSTFSKSANISSNGSTIPSSTASSSTTNKVILPYVYKGHPGLHDDTARYLSQEWHWITEDEYDEDDDDYDYENDKFYNDEDEELVLVDENLCNFIQVPRRESYTRSITCPILIMQDLMNNPSSGKSELMREILDHQHARAYLPAEQGREALSRLRSNLEQDKFTIPKGCPSKYHESLRMLNPLLQMIFENPISSSDDYQKMLFELQPCRFPLASAATLCEMISWFNENEDATMEDCFAQFELRINSMVDDACLGKTSAGERSSTASMRGMNFFNGEGKSVEKLENILKHNEYETNVEEIKEFLRWSIEYLKIDGMFERVVDQRKFTIKFFELIKWIFCNKGWLGRPLALKRAFFHFMYNDGQKKQNQNEEDEAEEVQFLNGFDSERVLHACAQGDKDGNWKANRVSTHTSNNHEVVLDALSSSIRVGSALDNNTAVNNKLLRTDRFEKQLSITDFLKKETVHIKQIESDIKSVKTEKEKDREIMLLLTQNKYRNRLSTIPCYCRKCGEKVFIENRFMVRDESDKSGFTLKKCGSQKRKIMCSYKICGKHRMWVTYHSSKNLGAVYGLGAHGFIKLPQKCNHGVSRRTKVAPDIPVVRQVCDYPTCDTRTSLCCVNKECLKKKRASSSVSRSRNLITTYTGTFYCNIHGVEHLHERMRIERDVDEKLIHYRKKICEGYHCEYNNEAGIKIQKQITNVVRLFEWTDRHKENLILGYEKYKDNTITKQVTKYSKVNNYTYTENRVVPYIWPAIYDTYFKECEIVTSHMKNNKNNGTTHEEKVLILLSKKYYRIRVNEPQLIENVLRKNKNK